MNVSLRAVKNPVPIFRTDLKNMKDGMIFHRVLRCSLDRKTNGNYFSSNIAFDIRTLPVSNV